MMDDTLSYVWTASEMRMHGDGVFAPDLKTLKESIDNWDDWLTAWGRLGEEYEARGDEALANGYRITAGEHYWQAAISWHYGQFLWFHRPDERRQAQQRKVATYLKSAPLLSPPAERIDIDFEGTKIPSYLRLPMAGTAPFPCVVLIGGLESTKEESYHFENACLRRGLATMAFDGPGQGEYHIQRPLVGDFERYTSAVADHLLSRGDIDPARLAVIGRSLGGYYAVRSCTFDKRFKACVAFGALFDVKHLHDLHPVVQQGFRHITGHENAEEAERALNEFVDLEDVAPKLQTPLYLLHGEQDHLIPVSQARRLDQLVRDVHKEVVIEPDGGHCGHNIYHRVRRPMIDWVTTQLEAVQAAPAAVES